LDCHDLIHGVRVWSIAAKEVAPGSMAIGRPVIEAGEHGEIVLVVSQWGQRRGKVVAFTHFFGKECVLVPTEVGPDRHEVFSARG